MFASLQFHSMKHSASRWCQPSKQRTIQVFLSYTGEAINCPVPKLLLLILYYQLWIQISCKIILIIFQVSSFIGVEGIHWSNLQHPTLWDQKVQPLKSYSSMNFHSHPGKSLLNMLLRFISLNGCHLSAHLIKLETNIFQYLTNTQYGDKCSMSLLHKGCTYFRKPQWQHWVHWYKILGTWKKLQALKSDWQVTCHSKFHLDSSYSKYIVRYTLALLPFLLSHTSKTSFWKSIFRDSGKITRIYALLLPSSFTKQKYIYTYVITILILLLFFLTHYLLMTSS